MMLLAWLVYPLVLAALCAGWGVLVENASGAEFNDVLLIPNCVTHALMFAGCQNADRRPERFQDLVAAGPRYDRMEDPILIDEGLLILYHLHPFDRLLKLIDILLSAI